MSEENGIASQVSEAGQPQEGQLNSEEEQKTQEQRSGNEPSDGETQSEKPEKTPEQREIERLRRGLERQRQRAAQWRAKAEIQGQQQTSLTSQQPGVDYQSPTGDSEPLSLTKAQFAEAVLRKAHELAPTLTQQGAELAKRQGVIQSLEKKLGAERFNEVSESLDESFGGLTDSSGRPKPAVDAIFESDDPVAIVEYLADPEHAEEAERIAEMSAVKAGMALARIESKLSSEKKQQNVSKAPKPLQEIKGGGGNPSALPQDSDPIDVWLEKERARMKSKGIIDYG